jgi:hypothetical protein
MAVSYPKELGLPDTDANGHGILGPEHLDGTATEAVDAEYVFFNSNCDTQCSVAGELIVGVVADISLPEVTKELPSTSNPLGVINVFFQVPANAQPGDEYPIVFANGLHGSGDATRDPAIDNKVVVNNQALDPFTDNPGLISVGGKFIRGDCNLDGDVNIADPPTTMSVLVGNLTSTPFETDCLDACDSNDDGMVDLNDVLNTLYFLFEQRGDIPAPYPGEGYDPTPDGNICIN